MSYHKQFPTAHKGKKPATAAFSLSLILCLVFVPADHASADLMGGLKSLRDKVKEVKDTVVGTREVYREVEDLRQTVVYTDSYTPPRGELSLMQAALNQLGFSAGNPDGLMGEKTRDGIRLFQATRGQNVDGAMSYELVQSIIAAGRQSNSAGAKLQKFEWQQYQQTLNQLGYDTGTPDGVPGPRTRAAVARFLQDNQFPVVSGIDRYGFEAAQRVARGGQARNAALSGNNQGFSSNSGGLGANQSTQEYSSNGAAGGGSLNQNSALSNALSDAGLSSDSSGAPSEGEWLTLGSDQRSGNSDEAASRALALMLINDNPEVLEDLNRVDTWFKHEGNSVASEYLREPALQDFRESLRQQPVERPIRLQVLRNVFLRRGDYDQNAGLFKVSVGNSSLGSSFRLPHLGFSSVSLGLEAQYPSETPGDDFSGPVIGIPMTLEQAIAFEQSEMTNSRGNPEDVVMMTLVSNALVNGIKMAPLERGQDASQNSFRTISAASTLTGLSLFKRPEGRNQGSVGELVYQWPASSFSPTVQPGLVAPTENVAVSASLQAVAQRFGMSIVNGHLDTSTGDRSSFAAALALGKNPQLLDKSPEALVLAEALLSRDERRELFGRVNTYRDLDEIAAAAVHDRVRGQLRQLFLSRAISHELPILLVHDAKLGDYDVSEKLFKLRANDALYSGQFSITRTGRGPFLVADTGDRWLPEQVTLDGEKAATFRQTVFGDQSKRPAASVRHGRFGSIADINIDMLRSSANRGQGGNMRVTLDFTVQREVLLAQKFDEILFEFPAVDARQESFSKLVSTVSKTTASSGALLDAVANFPEVDSFRQQFVLSSNSVRAANEFDRGERISEVNDYLTRQAARQSGPLWLEGTVQLGEYQFGSESFSVQSLNLAAAPGISASNQVQFRAKINHKHYGELNVSMSKDEAERFVKSNAGRTAAIRARVTPMGAVASLNEARPGSASLTITYQVNELALLHAPREKTRQQWRLLSHDLYDEATAQKADVVSEGEGIAPVAVNWESEPFLNPDTLVLMAAKSAELTDEQSWQWLQANRHILDTQGLTRFTTGFFPADAPAWDRGIGQINGPRFKEWVNALQFPTLEAETVQIHLSTGYQMERGSLSHCHLARAAVQWSSNIKPSFESSVSPEQMREKAAEVAQLRSGEFLVEAPAIAGFISSSAQACKDGRDKGDQMIDAPGITLTFNELPITAAGSSGAKSAVVTATVDRVEFVSGTSPIPDTHIKLTFEKADYYSALDSTTSPIINTIAKDDLVSDEPQGKDPRLAAADVVGVKLGMSLADATNVLDAHFEQAERIAIRRGFTTKPSRFEQGELWLASGGGEYIVIFHEGDDSSAKVLGVTRGLYLQGTDFDRNAALGVLRSKYGPEQIVSAEDSLNMVWGKYVDSWPTQVGRQQSGYKSGRGACQIDLSQGRVPSNLRDESGALIDLREILQASGRAQGFHVRWPQISNSSKQDLSDCDYYLEAFHDDRDDVRVFAGMFDLSAYEAAFDETLLATEAGQVEASATDSGKSAVKF